MACTRKILGAIPWHHWHWVRCGGYRPKKRLGCALGGLQKQSVLQCCHCKVETIVDYEFRM